MRANIICTAGAVGAYALTVLVGWYDGVDYFVRGKDQAFWTTEALFAAMTAFMFLRLKYMPAIPVLGPRWARIVATAFAFILVLAEAWYAGANPFERGHGQGGIFYMAFIAAFLCWMCPLWKPIGLKSDGKPF